MELAPVFPIEEYKKNTPWYFKKGHKATINGVDKDRVIRYLSNPKYLKPGSLYKFTIYSRFQDRWGYFICAKSVIKAIKSGHVDIDIWQHANLVQRCYNKSKGTYFTSIFGNTRHFTFDIDDHPYIDTIEDLRAYIRSRGLPEPAIISHTSDRNFHVVYYGLGPGYSFDDKLKFLCIFAQIDEPVDGKNDLLDKLKAHGIDFRYNNVYKDHPEQEKFRIPGSINSKRVDEYGMSWGVSSWFNDEYDVEGFSLPEIPFQVFKSVKKDTDQFWKEFQKPIKTLLREQRITTNRAIAKQFAEILSDNITYLKNGELRLSQIRLAHVMGIAQPMVSRYLKRMVKEGILEVTEDYYFNSNSPFNRKARKYGVGPVLKEIIETEYDRKKQERRKGKTYDLTKPYVTGEVWEHMSTDIRYMCMMGFEFDQISKFLHIKDVESRETVKSGRFRTENDIQCMARHCVDKLAEWGKTIAYRPPFSLEEKLKEFRERV